MGAILAKFRKEKTTYQLLENLEEQIKELEQYTLSTQATQKRYVGNFLVISIALYVICFLVFYFAFFPPTWMERITYSVPVLIFPMIIFLLKRLVAWYFQRKLNKNSSKLSDLKADKKKIIERVMDKETYKVALEILNRFGEKSNNSFKAASPSTPLVVRPTIGSSPMQSKSAVRQPVLTVTSPGGRLPAGMQPMTPISSQQRRPLSSANFTPSGGGSAMAMRQPFGGGPPTPYNIQPRKRTPYPIINQQAKGVLEKMVDYLIGDGPQNRFAMICRECYGHNGMALQEEYEYTAFRCAFCGALNPSRKSRPIAPKLPTYTPTTLAHANSGQDNSSSSTSTSEKDSGSDSEEDRNIHRKSPLHQEEEPSASVSFIENPIEIQHPLESEETINNVDCEILDHKNIVSEENVEGEESKTINETNGKPDVEKKND